MCCVRSPVVSTSPIIWWTAATRYRSPGSTSARSPCRATRRASIAYYAHGFVFSGDVLFSGSVGRTDLDGGSHQRLLESIAAMYEVLPPETVVLSGHGPITTLEAELATNPFLAELRP